MIVIDRAFAGPFRALARKCVLGRPRGPAPPVLVTQSPAGTEYRCDFGEVVLALRHSRPVGPATCVAIPGALLEEFESRKSQNASIDVGGDRVRCVWNDGAAQRESTWTPLKVPESFGIETAQFQPIDRSIVDALHECGASTARDTVKFAMSRVQIQGRSGRVAGSDGHQLLIWKGFEFPFEDSILVPAVPVFGVKPLSEAEDVRIARTERHVLLAVGPWTVGLAIDATGRRYPDVAQVIPAECGAELHWDNDDRQKAIEFCQQAVSADDDPVAITVAINASSCLRALIGADRRRSELTLRRSRSSGSAVTLALNRDHLQRALAWGLPSLRTPNENGPVVLEDARRTYVSTAFVPDLALAPSRRREPVLPAKPCPTSEGILPMPSQTHGAQPPEPHPAETLDFLAEAEGLRDALVDIARRASRLVGSLKQLQKQRRVLETAWLSLKSLRLGS